MHPPLIRRPNRSKPYRTRERGVTMALVGVALVAMIAMAGLSIDVGTLYEASAEAQRAADAGALAAARTISMQGLTGDPQEGQPATWSEVCGGATSAAYLAAKTVVSQNPISGASSLPVVTVNYSYGSNTGSAVDDCSALGGGQAGVNMFVSVQVQQTNLPTYFSRIWGRTGNTVSATAVAEVFNSSNSYSYAGSGDVVPVQPRCVKPWMIPNIDPYLVCSPGTCPQFVSPTTGVIQRPGVFQNGAGVIGERFWLLADCVATGSTCALLGGLGAQPQANYTGVEPTPNLQYVPGQVPSFSSAFTAIPSCASGATTYAQAIAGCDQSTKYQCGTPLGNVVDLSENPVPTDTTSGIQCLTHQTATTIGTTSGQDFLLPTGTITGGLPLNYPFQIAAGTSNPLAAVQGNIITSSNSIVSLPIYDSANTITSPSTTNVTIVGFLQVFIDVVDAFGNMHVTVLNVSGCGNGGTPVSATPVYGTSPVPVRLITSP